MPVSLLIDIVLAGGTLAAPSDGRHQAGTTEHVTAHGGSQETSSLFNISQTLQTHWATRAQLRGGGGRLQSLGGGEWRGSRRRLSQVDKILTDVGPSSGPFPPRWRDNSRSLNII